ncbi:MAG: C40 family peptidase [Elusimicrobiota bacterium]|jgi:hypothetical protein
MGQARSPRHEVVLAAALALALSGCAGAQRRGATRRPIPPLAKAVVRTAKSYLPEEEKGRKLPKDCSDYVHAVFKENGIELPRTSLEMARRGEPLASSGDLQMGDLVFFSGSKPSSTVGHIGIYVNNGIFIHFAKEETGVTMESMYSDYYRKRYLKARRVIP